MIDNRLLGLTICMKRYHQNPIIDRSRIPVIQPRVVDVSSVFNPGAAWFHDHIVLLLRVQNRGRETILLPAFSRDGVAFEIRPEPIVIDGLQSLAFPLYHVYDPRVTRIGDEYFVTLAIDTDAGCRIALVRTNDFAKFTLIGVALAGDARNGVLFPERIRGKYVMLYRPNRARVDGQVASGSEIELATSTDLLTWTSEAAVMSGRFHYWDEYIGSGPPPLKTRHGWLHVYHGVATHFAASNIYQAGVVLLDLENPARVLARSRYNILEPRELYELVGQVPNVVFPTGLVPAHGDRQGTLADDTDLLLYYGAADTCVGLVHTSVGELIGVCDAV